MRNLFLKEEKDDWYSFDVTLGNELQSYILNFAKNVLRARTCTYIIIDYKDCIEELETKFKERGQVVSGIYFGIGIKVKQDLYCVEINQEEVKEIFSSWNDGSTKSEYLIFSNESIMEEIKKIGSVRIRKVVEKIYELGFKQEAMISYSDWIDEDERLTFYLKRSFAKEFYYIIEKFIFGE